MKSGRRRGRVLCNWKVTKRKVFRLLFLLKIVVAPPRFLDIYPLLPFDQPEIRLGVMFSSKEVKTLAETKSIRKTWTLNRENKTENHHSLFPLASLIESCSVGEKYIEYTLVYFSLVYYLYLALMKQVLVVACTTC